jgi:hypothetical protein
MDHDTQKPDLPKIAKAWISFFLILIVIAAGAGFYAYRQSAGASRGSIVEKELPPLVSDLRGREGGTLAVGCQGKRNERSLSASCQKPWPLGICGACQAYQASQQAPERVSLTIRI